MIMPSGEDHWFQKFQVVLDEELESEVVWDDQFPGPRSVRKPTRAEKLSIVIVGVTAIGFIVIMVATLLVAVYFSRK